MRENVPDLMLLFDGYRESYGTYGTTLDDVGGGKLKGVASTVKGRITVDLWMSHLQGKVGLGIIPIDNTNRVKFAAIDIDEYPLDLIKLNENIQRLSLPLVLCRTKSGGAHLYLFLDSAYSAGDIQTKMREMAALLGHGNAEIFPKQTKLVAERGDIGSWINMPYFDLAETKRYCIGPDGKQLNFHQFMEYARSRITSYKELCNTQSLEQELLLGGPPCLNHLVAMGFPQGTRNNGLFNLCVYAKKSHGDDWKTYVREFNSRFMNPPLDESEVEGIIKSIERKEFNYTCKQAPIANYCNMPKCRSCKHGVGLGDIGMPKFGSLTKLMTSPPIWFLEIEGGGRLELSTDDLQSPRNFQNRCMEVLNIMPICPKMDTWQEIIHKLLQDVNEVEVPAEATPSGQLWNHLEDFCTSRVSAKLKDEIILGKPFHENGIIYFRLRDFLDYIERRKWKGMPLAHIQMYLAKWKCGKQFFNIKGRGTNCYTIEAQRFESQKESFETATILNPEKVLS